MNNPSHSLISRGSLAFNRYFHNFFSNPMPTNGSDTVKQVLPVQPITQRKLFTDLAVNDHRSIFVQFNPLTSEGQITNCRGKLYALSNKRFLLRSVNVSYIFSLSQIRYIAG
ncbi:hypothetical protein [uncultured Limosilactobacillus sp.]|uniref:hypothetical protein n=1 Tax=uncultured Limosilactobacillus sp. TaxID=2837629 RepID=UPI0025F99F32|nr:hypothetical protein [uncultured Limosilactobacillus sp.]